MFNACGSTCVQRPTSTAALKLPWILKNPGSLQRGCRGCSGYMGICRIQGLALILRILHVPKYLIYLGMMVLQPTKVMQDC